MKDPDAFFRAITPRIDRDQLTLSLDSKQLDDVLAELVRFGNRAGPPPAPIRERGRRARAE